MGSSLKQGPFQVPKNAQHLYKRDPQGEPTLQKNPCVIVVQAVGFWVSVYDGFVTYRIVLGR